jgi:hypothetical protein
MKKYRPAAANGVNGAAWLGRLLLSSQAKNCRGSLECQPSAWIVHQAAPSKLGRRAPRSLLPLLPSDQPLRFVMDSPTIHECHSVNIRTWETPFIRQLLIVFAAYVQIRQDLES